MIGLDDRVFNKENSKIGIIRGISHNPSAERLLFISYDDGTEERVKESSDIVQIYREEETLEEKIKKLEEENLNLIRIKDNYLALLSKPIGKDFSCEDCEYLDNKSTDHCLEAYCKKYNTELDFYDWWLQCGECFINKMIETNEGLKAEIDSLKKELNKRN